MKVVLGSLILGWLVLDMVIAPCIARLLQRGP